MRELYPAWCETAGALDLLHQGHACAANGSQIEVATLQALCGQDAAAKRNIEEMIMDKTWEMLHLAASDSAYLGPPHEKPSVLHARDCKDEYALPPVRIWSGGCNLSGLGGLERLDD